MKPSILIKSAIFLCLVSTISYAADKGKAQSLIDAVKVNIDSLAGKGAENRDVAADLSQARENLKKAEETLAKGRQMFGLGDVKPEAEQDIRHFTSLAELSLSVAKTRMEGAKAEAEAEALGKQLATVNARVKKFEERKAEFEKCKADALKNQGVAKELETLKGEKGALASQVEQLKSDNARLTEQLEKLQAERKKVLPAVEGVKKTEIKQEQSTPPATKEAAPASATPPASAPLPAKANELPTDKEPPVGKDGK